MRFTFPEYMANGSLLKLLTENLKIHNYPKFLLATGSGFPIRQCGSPWYWLSGGNIYALNVKSLNILSKTLFARINCHCSVARKSFF